MFFTINECRFIYQNANIHSQINIIKLSDKQVNDMNKNLDIINKSKIFNKKITLSQNGSGIFSILLPMLASTIIPALIKKGKGNNSNLFWKQN